MRVLGLDVGDKRIGVAFGDTTVNIATPVSVITRGSFDHDTRALGDAIRKYDAERFIVGLPRNMDGTLGEQAQAVMTLAQHLERALKVPLAFWDERLTTVAATERRNATGARGKKSRQYLDAMAAAVILQDYLDSQRNETE
ncbi:MAG: Holliday junction resolvase RuvX [Chloroflexi bacterium]|nr:Holliday junction resolvase RuvX [Chloroflexota bacterium]